LSNSNKYKVNLNRVMVTCWEEKLHAMNLVSNIEIYLVTNRYNLKTNNKFI